VGNSDANDESFRVLEFAALRFAVGRVKKKPSVPRTRLACIHLQAPFRELIGWGARE
jgi:hypothetical protein